MAIMPTPSVFRPAQSGGVQLNSGRGVAVGVSVTVGVTVGVRGVGVGVGVRVGGRGVRVTVGETVGVNAWRTMSFWPIDSTGFAGS